MKIFNILKNLNSKIDRCYNRQIVSASWTAASSSSLWTNLTQSVSLSKGKWLAVIHVPITSTSTVGVRLDATSGSTSLNNNWYSLVPSQMTIPRLFEVTSATATVVLHCAQNASVTFSSTERGGVFYIKVGGVIHKLIGWLLPHRKVVTA